MPSYPAGNGYYDCVAFNIKHADIHAGKSFKKKLGGKKSTAGKWALLKTVRKNNFIRARLVYYLVTLALGIMKIIKIKGHSIEFIPAKDSFNRRALAHKNRLIRALGRLGVVRDDVELELDGHCGREAKAMVTWYYAGHRMQYGVASQKKFVDNLSVVSEVIEKEVELVLSEKKPLEEFIAEFAEDEDVHEERKEAREFFGLSHDHKDILEVNKRYKEMAKSLHPDMPTGDAEKFKKLNRAHKILKRELS